MPLNDRDLEQLELYLDHELSEADARDCDTRLSVDASLASELERLRGDRAVRMSAMSMAFDTDADSIERLVASVRMAKASEALQLRRRASWLPMRSILAAAACVAFGLTLGATLQLQHGRGGGMVATPMVDTSSTGSFGGGSNVNLGPSGLQGHGAYVVSVMENGREVMKMHFSSQQEARQFINRINSGDLSAPPIHVGDARILDEPY